MSTDHIKINAHRSGEQEVFARQGYLLAGPIGAGKTVGPSLGRALE